MNEIYYSETDEVLVLRNYFWVRPKLRASRNSERNAESQTRVLRMIKIASYVLPYEHTFAVVLKPVTVFDGTFFVSAVKGERHVRCQDGTSKSTLMI